MENHQIIEIRGLFVSNFIIYNEKEMVLIDGGFLGGIRLLKKTLVTIDKTLKDIDLILLTHGHLDHSYNLHQLKGLALAPIAGSASEQLHIDGCYPYKGITRLCGLLEGLGRTFFGYQKTRLDQHLVDGERIGLCGGIRTIHLPGHTVGHLGFLHEPSKTLFVGDLVRIAESQALLPPFFFNSCPKEFNHSFGKIKKMELNGLHSNHSHLLNSKEQLERFRKLEANRLKRQGN